MGKNETQYVLGIWMHDRLKNLNFITQTVEKLINANAAIGEFSFLQRIPIVL